MGGAYKDLRTFAVRVEGGCIEVLVPDEEPSMEERPIAV
jgi:hypothetical protein